MTDYSIDIALAWESSVGKVVGTFLGRATESKQDNKKPSYQVEIIELLHCWYKAQNDIGETVFNSPLLKSIDQMPEPLASEVQAFLGNIIEIPDLPKLQQLSSEIQRTLKEFRSAENMENRRFITMYVNNPLT